MLSLTKSLKEEIHNACRDMTEGEINRMIRRGIAPFTLLILGCQTDSLPLAEQALRSGADINGRDRESWTPLMHAAYYNSTGVLDYLLRQRVRLHSTTAGGESAFAIARTEGNAPALRRFEDRLKTIRLRHAGIFIEALAVLERERRKLPAERDSGALALSYIDRGYVWWIGEEHPEKTRTLFRKAWEAEPRIGAFPYASILAAQGFPEEALDILETIQVRRWPTIPRQSMVDSGLFDCLRENPRWQKILSRWPSHS